jgi:hypothetical protein
MSDGIGGNERICQKFEQNRAMISLWAFLDEFLLVVGIGYDAFCQAACPHGRHSSVQPGKFLFRKEAVERKVTV